MFRHAYPPHHTVPKEEYTVTPTRRSSGEEDPLKLLYEIQVKLGQIREAVSADPQILALVDDVAGDLEAFEAQLADKSAQESYDEIIDMMKLTLEFLILIANS